MNLIQYMKDMFLNLKRRLQGNELDNVLWIVNFVPNLVGFSIHKDNMSASAPYWIIHLSLLFYIYGVGSIMYQAKHAKAVIDFLKSYLNISLLVLIANNSVWWLKYRKLLRRVLKKMVQSDRQARQSPWLREEHERLLSMVKKIALLFYGCNVTNALVVYIPNRANPSSNSMSIVPCVGLEPLTENPNRSICTMFLAAEEIFIMIANLDYQVITMVIISHTAIMYQLLSKEIMRFNVDLKNTDINSLVEEKLPLLIRHHTLILDTVNDLKFLFSGAIGVNFGSNAVCMCVFFFMELGDYFMFAPVLIYCFLVFFFNCFLCQLLTNAAEEFERAVYCCGWENFDYKHRKSIYLMLLQSQKEVEVLAADIIPVNISTFATTLQWIYKFVTVVKF